jgi:hypothetical protein
MSLRAKRGNLHPIIVELAKCGRTIVKAKGLGDATHDANDLAFALLRFDETRLARRALMK